MGWSSGAPSPGITESWGIQGGSHTLSVGHRSGWREEQLNRRRRGTPEAISTHVSCTLPCAMLGPFREARPSAEYQVGGRLGLQRYPGVDTSPRHRQCGTPGIHGAEG